ncbi:unnamed protein product [Nesidiocoris tenuis]|uniref:Uncharacterized protein n=1 Tax=Nesidiocoris tenuis TaxID=355587 RepID=A0A6H5G0D8_9HEMI|nr:unnamed protein product [Nesidiocoris tenuis]
MTASDSLIWENGTPMAEFWVILSNSMLIGSCATIWSSPPSWVLAIVPQLRYSKRERDRVLQIVSKEDEKISLSRSFLAQGGIEHWLGTLLKLAKSSLGGIIGACYDFLGDPEFRILKMLEKFPAQVIIIDLYSRKQLTCVNS